MPIYLAAIGPKNVALAAEIADGWLPIFFSPERFAETHRPMLEEGFARRGGRARRVGRRRARPGRPRRRRRRRRATRSSRCSRCTSAGWAPRGGTSTRDLAERYGYADAAATVQDLYLAGKKGEAAAAVPDALVDEVALVGDRARIADRLAAFRDCGVDTLVLQARQPEALRLLADLA